MLSREIACTIFQVFGMTRPGMEPQPTAYKASILPTGHGQTLLASIVLAEQISCCFSLRVPCLRYSPLPLLTYPYTQFYCMHSSSPWECLHPILSYVESVPFFSWLFLIFSVLCVSLFPGAKLGAYGSNLTSPSSF